MWLGYAYDDGDWDVERGGFYRNELLLFEPLDLLPRHWQYNCCLDVGEVGASRGDEPCNI
jgi:hypothetical protein